MRVLCLGAGRITEAGEIRDFLHVVRATAQNQPVLFSQFVFAAKCAERFDRVAGRIDADEHEIGLITGAARELLLDRLHVCDDRRAGVLAVGKEHRHHHGPAA